MSSGFVICLDGPAASGKGTISKLLAEHFNGVNLYTGGMYRAVALACIQKNVSFDDISGIEDILKEVNIDLDIPVDGYQATVLLNGEDVSDQLTNSQVAIGSGKISKLGIVREFLLEKQRNLVTKFLAQGRNVILDGQDTATYVYPDAGIKIFLTASQEVRAERRLAQYKKLGVNLSKEALLAEISERDEGDFNRKLHPLSNDPEKDGYFYLDSSKIDEYKTMETILRFIESKKL